MSATPTATLEIALLVKGRATRTWSSDDGVVTVGCAEGMTIRAARGILQDHHATIHVEQDQVVAVAEGDAEIRHNGQPASVAVVAPDDVLQIGPFTLQARRSDPPEDAPTPRPPARVPPPVEPTPETTRRIYTGTPVASPRRVR